MVDMKTADDWSASWMGTTIDPVGLCMLKRGVGCAPYLKDGKVTKLNGFVPKCIKMWFPY